jgi:hypothetical protein
MNTDLQVTVTHGEGEGVGHSLVASPSPQLPAAAQFLPMLQKMSTDPTVDPAKMSAILDVLERQMNKAASQAYENALADLQDELPRIKKDGMIEHKDKATGKVQKIAGYATYENIDEVIRPLLIKHRFNLRFSTRESNGKVVVSGTLAHREGHKETVDIPLSIDASGAKNSVQGVGSTISYGKRYIVGMLLNLIFEGEDDDGKTSGFIALTDEQAATLKDLIRDTGTDVTAFLAWVKAKDVDSMDGRQYDAAYRMLNKKKSDGKVGA